MRSLPLVLFVWDSVNIRVMTSEKEQTIYRIPFERDGKHFFATVEADSQEQAVEKLRQQLKTELPVPQKETHSRTLRLTVQGTHCASCEVLIERKFKKLPGVEAANVNYRTGTAVITLSGKKRPSMDAFNVAVNDQGYHVQAWTDTPGIKGFFRKWSARDRRELGAALLVLFGIYLILQQFDLLPNGFAIAEGITLPAIFVIGLVAAGSSCLAVVGGLLLSMSGTMRQTSIESSAWKRFEPHILFNAGRLVSYTLLGGLIALLGRAIGISTTASGALMVLAAAFMLLTGLSMLNIIGRNPLLISIPKSWQNALQEGSRKKSGSVHFGIGAATFFLPCGFTQAMQLHAMMTGSFVAGAAAMGVFALGTMPALLGIGAMSAFSRGTPYRFFLKFAGAAVLALGLFNANNGMTLLGAPPLALAASVRGALVSAEGTKGPGGSGAVGIAAELVDGKQIAEMSVYFRGYEPSQFTVKKGTPVEWQIEGVETFGCTSDLVVPKLKIRKAITNGKNVITFTPKEAGTIPFSCSMGMYRGQFTVVN